MGSWLLHSLRCEGYRRVGYCILYVVRAKGLLVITFSTLRGLWGIGYCILHVVRATGELVIAFSTL